MSQVNYEEFCQEALRARTAKTTSSNKTDDLIAVALTLGLVATQVTKVISSLNSKPLPQA